MTEDPSLLSEADSGGSGGEGGGLLCRVGLHFHSECGPCVLMRRQPRTGPVPALFRCQGEHRRRSWLDNSHGTFACGNPRVAELLKLGYMGCISNDIPTNKAKTPWLRQVALWWRVMHGAWDWAM